MTGKCRLCEELRELRESHLLPRALYKRLLDKVNRKPHPLLFSEKDGHQTSRQAQQYLLCSDCEQRFHRYGEDWTLDYCARDPNTFKLRDLLLSQTCSEVADGIYCFYCADIPDVNVDALCYFALSVVWRAAVTRWRIDNVPITRLDLGPYAGAFREYLQGVAGFPKDTVLWVCVTSLTEVPLICTFPETRNWGDYRSHFFSIPGITFTVDVGKRIPQGVRDTCLYRGRRRPLFYTAVADLVNVRDFARLATMHGEGATVLRAQ